LVESLKKNKINQYNSNKNEKNKNKLRRKFDTLYLFLSIRKAFYKWSFEGPKKLKT